MASKQVQHRKGEEAAAPAAEKQKKVAAERRNRRALGDIGNLVSVKGVDAKPIPRICRPVTRSFGARLLAQTNKNSSESDGNEPEKRAVARRPTQRKAASRKPKPEEVIESSPSLNEEIKSKKNAPTLTLILSARSKAACGVSSKKKEKILDIDAEDSEGMANDYMHSQPDINERMRAILIDWLIQVHYKFELSLETLYLTINVVDRYLASEAVSRNKLQLVGMSAMLVASKYEEIWAPQVNDLVCISDRTYTNEQVLAMEKRILGRLEWNLTVPTPYVFLVRFIKASMTSSDVENMVYFLAELGVMNYKTSMYSPSMIAASAVYAARCTLDKTPMWNETLETHTGFSEQELMDCAKMLVALHSVAGDQKQKAIYRKYSSCERGAVALLPPAKSLLE